MMPLWHERRCTIKPHPLLFLFLTSHFSFCHHPFPTVLTTESHLGISRSTSLDARFVYLAFPYSWAQLFIIFSFPPFLSLFLSFLSFCQYHFHLCVCVRSRFCFFLFLLFTCFLFFLFFTLFGSLYLFLFSCVYVFVISLFWVMCTYSMVRGMYH